MARLVAAEPRTELVGTRVVIDVRPLQEPERTPITAEYLEHLLAAFADEPLAGESFVVVSRTMRPDPTRALEQRGLLVAGRRRLPPTSRVLRSAGLTLDSFLLRGAELGATRGATEDGRSGAVYHTAGGAVPLGSQVPVVATLLDLAPWELPELYARSAAARFGHRLRARVLRDAARVIVCSRATADVVRRRLHLPRTRIAVVPLAVDERFRTAGSDDRAADATRRRLALPERYLLFAGLYDARKDIATLLHALRRLRSPTSHDADAPEHGPPKVVFAAEFESAHDRLMLERAVARSGTGELVRFLPALQQAERAQVMAGALGLLYPSLSEATGLRALEALSLGVPVIASRAGALPEIVGSAGIVVEPRDPARLAAAIGVLWHGGPLAEQLRRQARSRAEGPARSWRDVARETRQVYAAAASERRPPG